MPTSDPHIRNVLIFPPGKDLHDHPLVKSGQIILQDKSSCFSAQVLSDSLLSKSNLIDSKMDMIDACAAPGNKTSHLATLLDLRAKEKATSTSSSSMSPAAPTVFAFDKSAPRLAVLERRMREQGANHIVEPMLQSFLDVDPLDPK
jgi:putative methyltransferase